MGDRAVAGVVAAGAIGMHNPVKEKFEKRIKMCKHATIAFYVLMVVFLLVGIVIIAFFAKKWDTQKWIVIVGIVLTLLGLIFLIAAVIATIIICKVFKNMERMGDPARPVPVETLANMKYPRQKEFEPLAEPLEPVPPTRF